jgi:APA family basic amino acid/polyamine antiporter
MSRKYGQLLQVLGIAFGWAVTVGQTVGAGILRAPGEVAQHVPSVSAFYAIWLIGAAYALLGALSLAELGTMIPESGGQTVFVKRAFGAFPGFAVAWSDWLSSAASASLVTIVLLEAVVAIVPALAPFQALLAVLVILTFAVIQWQGIRATGSVQIVTSALKTVAFVALVIACFMTAAPAATSVAAAAPTAITLAGIMLSLQAMVFTYDGWSTVLYFSGEVSNPGRNIPRSMVFGVLSVFAIYMLINAAFLHLIPLKSMAGDPMVADTASRIVFGVAGTAFIRALIAVSLLSTIHACILCASRVLYATGVHHVNTGGTPTHALAVSTLVSVVLVVSGTFNQVLALASFFFVANYSMSFSAVFKLRRSEPGTPRPYRAWGYPVTTALVLAASVAFLVAVIISAPEPSAWAMALLALSYPVHRFIQRRKV